MSNFYVTRVVVRRTASNVIEYDVTARSGPTEETRTYHANREATFFGSHTGRGDARQLSGGARTFWRDTDSAMVAAFKRLYRNAEVVIA